MFVFACACFCYFFRLFALQSVARHSTNWLLTRRCCWCYCYSCCCCCCFRGRSFFPSVEVHNVQPWFIQNISWYLEANKLLPLFLGSHLSARALLARWFCPSCWLVIFSNVKNLYGKLIGCNAFSYVKYRNKKFQRLTKTLFKNCYHGFHCLVCLKKSITSCENRANSFFKKSYVIFKSLAGCLIVQISHQRTIIIYCNKCNKSYE